MNYLVFYVYFFLIKAHTGSLLNVHVLDTSCFLTVGINQNHPPPLPSSEVISGNQQVTDKPSMDETTNPDSSTQQVTTPPQETPTTTDDTPQTAPGEEGVVVEEDIVSPFKNMSINSNSSVSQWEYGKPVKNIKTLDNLGSITCSAFYQHTLLGNRFLALGLTGGAVKICNLPSLSIASEIHFQDIIDKDCKHIALNLSREKEHTYNFNFKNPFRDLILTSVWCDGRVMVCQVDPRRIS